MSLELYYLGMHLDFRIWDRTDEFRVEEDIGCGWIVERMAIGSTLLGICGIWSWKSHSYLILVDSQFNASRSASADYPNRFFAM
jgi:hypothetical protein